MAQKAISGPFFFGSSESFIAERSIKVR
jgi:hypothetical protein